MKPKSVQAKNKGALLGKKLDALKVEKQYLYEQFKMKQLEKDEYMDKVEKLRGEEQKINGEIGKIEIVRKKI